MTRKDLAQLVSVNEATVICPPVSCICNDIFECWVLHFTVDIEKIGVYLEKKYNFREGARIHIR